MKKALFAHSTLFWGWRRGDIWVRFGPNLCFRYVMSRTFVAARQDSCILPNGRNSPLIAPLSSVSTRQIGNIRANLWIRRAFAPDGALWADVLVDLGASVAMLEVN
jgi:hypothetical protein